jgi:hypothetical protein
MERRAGINRPSAYKKRREEKRREEEEEDLFLFPKMKLKLKGRRFGTVEEI